MKNRGSKENWKLVKQSKGITSQSLEKISNKGLVRRIWNPFVKNSKK